MMFLIVMYSSIFADTAIDNEIALEYGLELTIEENDEPAVAGEFITNTLVSSIDEYEIFQQYDLNQRKLTLREWINSLDIELEPEKEEVMAVVTEQPAADTKYAYLTFDDGPSDNTVMILDCLQEYGVKATFFVLEVPGREDVYKRIVDEGHAIALHSSTHEYSEIYLTVDSYLDDIANLADVILEHTGVTTSLLRFPGGSNNTISHRYGGTDIMDRIIEATNAAGYVYFDWNVDSLDASKVTQDKDVIVNAVLDQSSVLKQPVILMHDSKYKTTTPEALPEIIEGLTQLGFSFEKLTPTTPVVQFNLNK